ncbi:hypothetical protein TTRE_0000143701 [Trichuris trichiura]|uniref:Uncharacterized protein n=1 Tax=Trichuris trichiura TaxID=36087 RepID=A0A077YZJ9_TRITR|nr:hypothetical protein TTRE_0000143701 [Trichuris trichiura]
MLLRILVALLCKSLVQSLMDAPWMVKEGCDGPKGTEKHFLFRECNRDKLHSLNFTNVVILNDRDEVKYPIEIKRLMKLKLTAINKGCTLKSLLSSTYIAAYTKLFWFPCGWGYVPAFTLLSKRKVTCKNCPIKFGKSEVELHFNFSAQDPVVRYLPSHMPNHNVYALDITLYDAAKPAREVGCLRIEARVNTTTGRIDPEFQKEVDRLKLIHSKKVKS